MSLRCCVIMLHIYSISFRYLLRPASLLNPQIIAFNSPHPTDNFISLISNVPKNRRYNAHYPWHRYEKIIECSLLCNQRLVIGSWHSLKFNTCSQTMHVILSFTCTVPWVDTGACRLCRVSWLSQKTPSIGISTCMIEQQYFIEQCTFNMTFAAYSYSIIEQIIT